MKNLKENKTFDNRKGDERKEGYKTVKTELPSERFQSEKQVLSPDELGVTKSSIPGDDKAVTTSNLKNETVKKVVSKVKIRPEVSVEELKTNQVGGVPLTSSAGLRSVAGLSTQSSGDDTSKIPYTKGDYRPKTRYGKKRSEDLFEMDNTISEQLAPIVEDSLDLREAPEAKQGYNGRKQFKQTRGKKNFSFGGNKLPQQLLNDASLDFITTDKMVYISGQVIGCPEAEANYPTVTADGTPVSNPFQKGNYVPTALKITVSDGHITGLKIDEDRYYVDAAPLVRDESNLNWKIDSNNVAKSMVKIQTELGRETTDKWSPLAYVIHQPYQFNMLMHDIEASTGAFMAAAYRAAVSSMAYQRNILAKDGINPQRNAIKMILEGYIGPMADTQVDTIKNSSFSDIIFQQSEYQKGSVAGLIRMFDSVGKYKTKADLLGQQRSLSLHLSQADNNINPLHTKPNFIKALDKAHMFSTVDGGYNPMLPIFDTCNIKLVSPVSLNSFLYGWVNPSLRNGEIPNDVDATTGTKSKYTYKYDDLRNQYVTRVQHPLIEGLIRWLLKHEGAFVSVFGAGTTVIPWTFNMQAPNLLSFMLCSAAQDVAWERNIIFRDILFAGEQSTYIWDDLMDLGKLNPLFSSQLSIGGYTEPLKLGRLAQDTVIRELWSGHMGLSDSDTSDGIFQFFLPWYFNEQSITSRSLTSTYSLTEGYFDEENAFNMSWPSIRDGVRHEYVDLLHSMTERDVRLSLDRYTSPIRFCTITPQSTGTTNNVEDRLFTTYTPIATATANSSYVKFGSLRYDINSDGRIVAKYDLLSDSNRDLPAKGLYCIPKEIGFIDDWYGPRDVITCVDYDYVHSVPDITTTSILGQYEDLGLLEDKVCYNGYSPQYLTSYRVDANSSSDGSISRSAALTQSLNRCFASIEANDINENYVARIGLIPSLSYQDGAALEVTPIFNIRSSIGSSSMLEPEVATYAHRIWTMLQRVFLPINRFENCFTFDENVNSYDPLETSFYFGVCGFLASDYTQDVLERLDVHDQLGIDYTEDIFVKESPIFR